MGTLNNPGIYRCLDKLKANPDMPYFLLLASDPDAPKTVRDWAARYAQRPNAKGDKVAEALQVAKDMEDWRTVPAHHPFDDAIPTWLFRSWSGGVVFGVLISLGTFGVWVTR